MEGKSPDEESGALNKDDVGRKFEDETMVGIDSCFKRRRAADPDGG